MASVKLNVFHWHATDSQSWPLSVPAFPDLAIVAADQEGSYSAEDIDEIVGYAGDLGIAVMLEVSPFFLPARRMLTAHNLRIC
jgi:hexosaminidase